MAGHIVLEVTRGKGDFEELKQRLARLGIVMKEGKWTRTLIEPKPDEDEK
jgi:hypothetical protein